MTEAKTKLKMRWLEKKIEKCRPRPKLSNVRVGMCTVIVHTVGKYGVQSVGQAVPYAVGK